MFHRPRLSSSAGIITPEVILRTLFIEDMKLIERIFKKINDLANVRVVRLHSDIGQPDRLTMCNLVPVCDNRVQGIFSFSRNKLLKILAPFGVKPTNELE